MSIAVAASHDNALRVERRETPLANLHRRPVGQEAREPRHGVVREPDAAVRCSVPSGAIASGPRRPWSAIWPGTAVELLEDAGMSARRERPRPKGRCLRSASRARRRRTCREASVSQARRRPCAAARRARRSSATAPPAGRGSRRRRHGDETSLADDALIHPACPFGRPGSRTRSHSRPSPSRRSAVTGSAVCWRVSGRTGEIVERTLLESRGALRAGVASRSRAMVTSEPRAGPAPAGPPVATRAKAVATRRPVGIIRYIHR